MPGSDASKYRIEPLGAGHDRAAFSCGVPALDTYLRSQARQDVTRRVAAVFVLTNGETVAGFYTLSAFAIRLSELPDELSAKLPRYPLVPATLLGRLAISTQHRGRGLGQLLLQDALHRALDHSRSVASFAVVVDAKDENARNFYLRHGFSPFPETPARLYLQMTTIEPLFG